MMTKEIDVEGLIHRYCNALVLLGISISIVDDYKKLEAYHDNSNKCDWFLEAVNKVVYENKPIPEMPK